MKGLNMDMINIGMAVLAIIFLIVLIKRGMDKKNKKPYESEILGNLFGGQEHFRYAKDPETCSTLTNKYCMMMKDGSINNLLQPGEKILGELQQACGKDSYMNISNCYPSWATVEGGTHNSNLYPMVATVVNPRYSN